ncbi:MAG: hypothetical protein RTU30_14695, partial [Candidatus Thorarchaeota archaeon]
LDALEDAISFLPEETVLTGGDYLSVKGKTSSGMGYTPLKTMWLDISAHKGTGIVSSGSWYYNDNEYNFVTTDAISLIEHNVDLESRDPYVPPPTTTPPVSGTTPTETTEEPPPLFPSDPTVLLIMGGAGAVLLVVVLVILKKK